MQVVKDVALILLFLFILWLVVISIRPIILKWLEE